MACNFSYVIETEVLFEVTEIHVHCKSGNVSELVQETDEVVHVLSSSGISDDLCDRRSCNNYRPFKVRLFV